MTKMFSHHICYQAIKSARIRTSNITRCYNILLASTAVGALLVCSASRVRADCVVGNGAATCTGNISASGTGIVDGGIVFFNHGISTLNVNGLTSNIAPVTGHSGVAFFDDGLTDGHGINSMSISVATGEYSISTNGNGTPGIVGFFGGNGAVNIDSSGTITTDGNRSNGIVGESNLGGSVHIDNSSTITTHGYAASGIYGRAYFNGNVTINNLGNISASNERGHGISAFSGGGNVTLNNSGNITANGYAAAGIIGSSSDGGAVNITNSGSIYVSDRDARGIWGQSNNGGTVTITNSGDISISADGATGIYASSPDANITVNLTNGTIRGGLPTVGVWFENGANNSLNISSGASLVSTLDAFAVYGRSNNETINNSGTITGIVDLGGGVNAFNNLAGGQFNSGSTVNLSAGNTFTNAGTLSPNGTGSIGTTTITGNLVQSGSGILAVDINQGTSQETDLVTVNGSADLAGTVVPNIITLNIAEQDNDAFKILSATGGVTDSGLVAQDTAGFDFGVDFRGNDVFLVVENEVNSIVEILKGKGTPDQRAISKHIDALISAGGSDKMQTLFNALRLQSNGTELIKALNRLLPHAQVAQINGLLGSNQSFGNALLSCKVRDGSYAITREGECSWARISMRKLERDVDTDNPGIDENGFGFAGGFQFALQDQWRLGFAVGYEDISAKQHDAAQTLGKTDGERLQLGAVLKNQWGPLNAYSSITGNWGWYDTKRFVNLAGVGNTATSKQKVFSGVSRTRFSYLFEQGSGLYIKPMVDFSATYMHLGSYSETGAAGANLSVDGKSEWFLSATPALEIGGAFKGVGDILFRPYVRVGLTMFNNNNMAITSHFSDVSTEVAPFTLNNEFDKTFGEVEVGLHMLTTAEINLKLSYEGRFSDNTSQHVGSIKIGFKF